MKYIIFASFIVFNLSAKVLIITHAYNQPDLINMQVKTFKSLLNDEYEYVVFNDASNKDMEQKIENRCMQLGVRCFRIPQEIHNQLFLSPSETKFFGASVRHVNAIRYSLETIGFDHPGIVCLMDSDIFLIRSLSIEKYMQDKDVATFVKTHRNGAKYFWPGICFLNMNTLPDKKSLNFNCGYINGLTVDSGGWTHYYWEKYPELKVAHLDQLYCSKLYLADNHFNTAANNTISENTKINFYKDLGFNKNEIKFLLKKPDTFEFYFDNKFIHYRCASTHNQNTQNGQYKMKIFNELIENAINSIN